MEIFQRQQCPFLSESVPSLDNHNNPDNNLKAKKVVEQDKYFSRLMSSAILLQQDPQLTFIVENILNTVKAFTSFFIRKSHTFTEGTQLPDVEQHRNELRSLYVCRVLHGLATKQLTASSWRSGFFADCWGKHKAVHFDQLMTRIGRIATDKK